jgi:hypothetical protein
MVQSIGPPFSLHVTAQATQTVRKTVVHPLSSVKTDDNVGSQQLSTGKRIPQRILVTCDRAQGHYDSSSIN